MKEADVMSIKQYSLKDLNIIEELSLDGFLCAYTGEHWQTAWVSKMLRESMQHVGGENIDVYAMRCV